MDMNADGHATTTPTTQRDDEHRDQQRDVIVGRLPSREALAFQEAAGTCRQPLFLARQLSEFPMRALILIAAAALALAACGNNDQADNTQNVDENLTAENIVSNDVTAIDAVTGDAANMAADVDYSNLADNSLDNDAQRAPRRQAWPRSRRPAGAKAAPSEPRRQRDRPTPNKLRAARPPCAPAATGAISAAPSPARSPPRAPASRCCAVHRLDQEMVEVPAFELGRIDSRPAATPASARRPSAGRPRSRPWG